MCLGIPGQIIALEPDEPRLARVSVAGVERVVNITCILADGDQPADCIGDWVLVHVGFAMARIDAAEAERTLQLLTELGEAREELEQMRNGSPT